MFTDKNMLDINKWTESKPNVQSSNNQSSYTDNMDQSQSKSFGGGSFIGSSNTNTNSRGGFSTNSNFRGGNNPGFRGGHSSNYRGDSSNYRGGGNNSGYRGNQGQDNNRFNNNIDNNDHNDTNDRGNQGGSERGSNSFRGGYYRGGRGQR